ncbi:hypothetical protein [Hymenobacter bucti]|uniref:Uncharacterized protein n=1 Tax=Hymenobacter bucti TaxID=1844114 RepID=A0ABW4R181_9BACT
MPPPCTTCSWCWGSWLLRLLPTLAPETVQLVQAAMLQVPEALGCPVCQQELLAAVTLA